MIRSRVPILRVRVRVRGVGVGVRVRDPENLQSIFRQSNDKVELV